MLRDFATLPSLTLSEKHQLPDCCAIYFVVADSQVLYVGMATSLKKRWRNHHRLFQLEAIEKKQAVELFWLVCEQSQLPALERQYIAYYAPALNQSKVPTQKFTPSSVVLATSLKKLRGRLLCVGLDAERDPRLKTLVMAYLSAPSETRSATTAVRRVIQASNRRKDSLLHWTEVVRRKEGAHWKTRCEGVEIQLIPYIGERLTHNASLSDILIEERFASANSVSLEVCKQIRRSVKEMPFEDRLSVARRSVIGIERFPIECSARFGSIAGVDILCLTERQLQALLTNLPSLRVRYPALKALSAALLSVDKKS